MSISVHLGLFLGLLGPISVAAFDIEVERVKAIWMVQQAQSVNPNSWYERTEKILRRMRIIVQPQGRAFGEGSDGKAAAFTDIVNPGRTVYVCPPAVTKKYVDSLAATLIHEAVHVMGYDDECPAEKVEISVQNDIGVSPADTPYPHCGIPWDYRITKVKSAEVGKVARPASKRKRAGSTMHMQPAIFNFGR